MVCLVCVKMCDVMLLLDDEIIVCVFVSVFVFV